jgi:hypothetical protein
MANKRGSDAEGRRRTAAHMPPDRAIEPRKRAPADSGEVGSEGGSEGNERDKRDDRTRGTGQKSGSRGF